MGKNGRKNCTTERQRSIIIPLYVRYTIKITATGFIVFGVKAQFAQLSQVILSALKNSAYTRSYEKSMDEIVQRYRIN